MVLNNVREWRLKGSKRRRLPISQAHLAQRIGVSRSYITKLEQGKLRPSPDVMFKIAEYFDCTIEEIFFLAGPESKGQ